MTSQLDRGVSRRVIATAALVAAAAAVVGAVAFSFTQGPGESAMVGVVVRAGAASIETADQLGAREDLKITRVVAPEESWVSVYLKGMGGMTGRFVGSVHVPAGESRDILVPLDPSVKLTEEVIVMLQADRGVRGHLEFDPQRFAASPDKPYFSGGREVSVPVVVRFPDMTNSF